MEVPGAGCRDPHDWPSRPPNTAGRRHSDPDGGMAAREPPFPLVSPPGRRRARGRSRRRSACRRRPPFRIIFRVLVVRAAEVEAQPHMGRALEAPSADQSGAQPLVAVEVDPLAREALVVRHEPRRQVERDPYRLGGRRGGGVGAGDHRVLHPAGGPVPPPTATLASTGEDEGDQLRRFALLTRSGSRKREGGVASVNVVGFRV